VGGEGRGEGERRERGEGVTSRREMTAELISPRIIHTSANEVHNPASL
jgi:hypothetical protein